MLRYRTLPVFCLLMLLACNARAVIVAFGDSLVDRQNFYLASGSTFPDPALYDDGRFSNGPLWVEELADRMGMPVPTASLAGGTNFAFNGARITGASPAPYATVPNLELQVGSYLTATSNMASPTDLHVFWAGANDFFFGETDPNVPVTSLGGSISSLHAAGAREFMVLNLPSLGQTPFFRGTANEAALDFASAGFNTLLSIELESLRNSLADVTIYEVDIYSLFQEIQAAPGEFGLTNALDSSTTYDPVTGLATGLTSVDPDEYLFWDSVHPTTAGHRLIGIEAYAATVPEPCSATTVVLAAAAAAVYGWCIRRSMPYGRRGR